MFKQYKKVVPLFVLIASIAATVAQQFYGSDSIIEEMAEQVISVFLTDVDIDLTPLSPEILHKDIQYEALVRLQDNPQVKNEGKLLDAVTKKAEDVILAKFKLDEGNK